MGVGLAFREVAYAYPQREPTLRGVTFEAPPGRLTVVLGANGSGKTTLLRLAAGLARPRAGRVALADGTDAARASRAGRIGYIPQHLGLIRHASALENAAFGGMRRASLLSSVLGAATTELRDDALAALDAVGLLEKAQRPVKSLSGGERQRVAIARTLVQRPDVVVADEPLASLDAVQQRGTMELLSRMRDAGTTLLVSLHQIDVALANADLVCFLQDARLDAPRAPAGMTEEEARCALG